VQKSIQVAVDEHITLITPIWAPDFFTSLIGENNAVNPEKMKTLKTQMTKPPERSKTVISNKIILQIRVGLFNSQSGNNNKKTTSSGIAENKTPFRDIQNDRFVYINSHTVF